MSITINGSTNTITAASGVTVAGNTAVTGTLSATAQITTSSTADASTSVFAGNSASVAVAGGLAVAKAIAGGSQISCANLVAANSTGGLSLTNATFGNIVSTNTLYVDTTAGNIDLRPGGVTAGTFSSTGLAVTGTLSASSHILPTIDNTSNLGSAALGMKELFSDNGTINTSDARRKTEVSALSAAEINAAKQLAKEIGSFKFLAAVAEKGDAARLHIGMTVQRAIEIMESNGLNPFAYSFICHDAWDQQVVEHAAVEAKDAVLDDDGNVVEPAVEAKDAWTEVTLEAGDKYSFRAHELLLFMAAGFEARLSALEAA